MTDFLNKKVLLGVCGGVAAYKAAYVVREFIRLGAEVRVVMTQSAQAFITPMTLQALSGHEVRCDVFDPQAERAMGHIELARWADYVVIAPATANILASLAHGFADDLLTTLCLVTESPVFVCPAMNHSMWAHPATAANVKTLVTRGVIVVGPDSGDQACGETGLGRLVDLDTIVNALRLYQVYGCLQGRTVLITAGPTREAIDPVRYVSNHSSGKMGYALAEAAQMAGADVTLVSGSCAIMPPLGVRLVSVESALEMYDAVMHHLQPGMIFIGAAAVSDYRLPKPEEQKIKKQDQSSLTLTLVKNPDILAEVALRGIASFVVGFAAETERVLEHARLKLQAKQLDMIIANQVGNGVGFDTTEHEVTVLTKETEIGLAKTHKVRLAGEIIAILARSTQNVAQ